MKLVALLVMSIALASAHSYAQTSESLSSSGGGTSGGYGYQDHPSHTPTFGTRDTQGDESPFSSNPPTVQPVAATQASDASQPDPRSAIPEKPAPDEGK
jgi:hypothetical protein